MSQLTPVVAATLEIVGPGGAARREVVAGPVVIGRAPEAGLRLPHASVSRRHAEFLRDGDGRWSVRDVGSRNGTYVNGAGPIREHAVEDGDVLVIGEFTLRVLLADARPAGQADGLPPTDDAPGSVISSLSRAEPPRLSAEFIRVVFEFGRELSQVSGGAERLARLVRLPVGPALGAWWCHALEVREQGGALTLEPLHPPAAGAGRAGREAHLSHTVLRAMLDAGGPVIANNVLRPTGFQASMTVGPDVEPVAVIACPIDRPEGADGSRTSRALYVTLSPLVAGIEWLALVSLAVEQFCHSESAWAAREADRARASLEREMAWARELQAHTLPRHEPTEQDGLGLEWALRFEPCMAVGGDYADVIHRPDGQVLLVVADVSGKGLRAALVASKLHAIFNADESCRSLVELVNAANRHLCRSLPRGAFVTLVALLIDPRTGRGTCVNAGHPRAVTIDDEGRIREVAGGDNFPLGLIDEVMLGADVMIEPGQYLCLYTDGVTEMASPDGRMLDAEGFYELLTRVCARRPPVDRVETLATALRTELDAFRLTATPTDDLTLLVARR